MTRKDVHKFNVQVYDGKRLSQTSVVVITEVSVEIRLNDEKIIVSACTGNHLEELAVGFLRSEGIIKTLKDIKEVRLQREQNVVNIYTSEATGFSIPEYNRGKTIAASGARIGATDESGRTKASLSSHALHMTPAQASELMEQMLSAAHLHEETHGSHCSALAETDGLIVIREDIGRHNTIDMLGGYALLSGLDLPDKILLTTGRISSEMVGKAWTMGVPVIISHSAPTSRALQLLTDAGITLIGYVRGGKMNIYTHQERVTL